MTRFLSAAYMRLVAVTLALEYPAAKTIHLVADNLNIHRCKPLVEAFGAEMGAEVWDRLLESKAPLQRLKYHLPLIGAAVGVQRI